MSDHEKGQVSGSAAEIYEQFFVPALFADWPQHVIAAAEVQPGEDVLDVACGTGVLAREALIKVGSTGSVTGVDINEGMLAVAREKTPTITWKSGPAEALPFEDASFERVMCQFALMFFQDQAKAIAEMQRVTKPGGRASVAVWASLEDTPGYAEVAKLLNDLFGPEVAQSIEAPYSLGNIDVLHALFESSGIEDISIQSLDGKARFDSIDDWIYTDIKGWTLADVIDDEGFARLKQAAPDRLGQFVQANGFVEFDAPAHIVSFAV
ncbi:MAG: methyltransferase domain-containing protein [Chloroflexi bacterium]|nr:MAG: methyltransferase domain-containing protein [Chloroflexota bacterium]MBL1195609.1 methyltransferase domain-containing protein [Chloroflexota bacterium]NOH12896.1 methyltransferase domain-containing protein [Chloroflexota bacterium]